MKHKNLKWDERSLPTAIEETKEQFAKMYPDVPYDEKYILWLELSLFWQYYCKSLDCNVKIFFEDGDNTKIVDVENICVRTPYPNKCVSFACMKKGRKRSKGIILPFDSFEELSKIKHIKAYWTITDMHNKGADDRYYICVNYDLTFKEVEGARNFCLYSKETPIIALAAQTNEHGILVYRNTDNESALQEYDNVYMIAGKAGDSAPYQIDDFKGIVDQESGYAAWLHSPDPFNPALQMECFSSAEELEGHEAILFF